MRLSLISRLLALWGVAVAIACTAVWLRTRLKSTDHGEVIASVWRNGQIVARAVLASPADHDAALDRLATEEGASLVLEEVVGEGPVRATPEVIFGLSLVPGHDGLRARLGKATAYLTPDELLSRQIYDHGLPLQELTLTLGFDVPPVLQLLAQRLGTSVDQVVDHAQIERIRVRRLHATTTPTVTARSLAREDVREAALAAARYLARSVSADGRFRYMVEATTNQDMPGYDWARHAGAVYFMAQAAGALKAPELVDATRRSAALLAQNIAACGAQRCVADGDTSWLGTSALALLAFAEIAGTGMDPDRASLVADLARFIRTQQRPDGEFMHDFDRTTNRSVDHQGLYASGEAALALAHAHRVTHDPADLDAAARGLSHLVGPAWSFFGDRYYFGEEHWTCQVMADLWDERPNPKALDFCIRWQQYNRVIQLHEGETPFDSDGAIGVGPLVTPRLTIVGSRNEAAVATLSAAHKAGSPPEQIAVIEEQTRRAFALLLRQQLRPGLTHLFKDPAAVHGAMPGSEVDWQLRIDYAQHTGAALLRWLDLTQSR